MGKSTLLNALIGSKIAAVTSKPQTTRNRMIGILSAENYQIVFLDTPGVFDAEDKFNKILVSQATQSIKDADIIYVMIDISRKHDRLAYVVDVLLKNISIPCFLLLNKIDKAPDSFAVEFQSIVRKNEKRFGEILPISALKGDNLDVLLNKTLERLSEGPQYYDPDSLSDKDMRFLAQEIVREKAMRFTGEEVPYSVATLTEEYKERENAKDYARIVIYVEHDSQKGILIGKKGKVLKRIGTEARGDIERLAGKQVYLDLWVKVRKNWRKKDSDLREFGYLEGKN